MSVQKISIGIVLYKGEKYLEECIASLLGQSYENFELLLRDQGPEHEALAYVEEHFPEFLEDARVKIFRGGNLWHSGGHNTLIAEMSRDSHAYVCASNDMWYEENFLENLLEASEKNPEYSVLVPKLTKWDFDNPDQRLKKTDILDSCGIALQKNHHFFDRGQGEKDENQYPTGEIFGASGALFLLRKSGIELVQNPQTGEVFDEAIHYKNDVDLAYRLQWAGAKTLFVSNSLAYHDRQVGDNNKGENVVEKIQKFLDNQRSKSLWVKESSFYGHLVVLSKNFWGRGFSFQLNVQVFFYMLRASVFLLLSEPKVLLQYKKFWKNSGKIREKKETMRMNTAPENIQKFFI